MLSWVTRGPAAYLAAAVVLVIVALLGPACGSLGGAEFGGTSSSGAGSSGGVDGSIDGTGSSSGSGSGSSSGGFDGGDSGGLTPPTTALVVHGSPSLPDVRLCWASGGKLTTDVPFPGTGEMPASNYPGIPLGGAAAMGDASGLTDPTVTLFAIDAENLARLDEGRTSQYTCKELLQCGQTPNPAPPCLRYDMDYWPVAVALDAVQAGKSNVLAIGGCLAAALDPTASAARCGASWSPVAGNLHADAFELAPGLPADAGVLSVQAAQLSPGLAAMVTPGGAGDAGAAGDASAPPATVVVSFGARDAGDASVVATLGALGDVEPPGAPYAVALNGGLPAFGTTGFSIDVAGAGDAGGVHLFMSLVQAQQLVDPTQDPTQFFGHGQTYLVAVLGDPSAPPAFGSGGVYDGKGLHLLVVTAPAGK